MKKTLSHFKSLAFALVICSSLQTQAVVMVCRTTNPRSENVLRLETYLNRASNLDENAVALNPYEFPTTLDLEKEAVSQRTLLEDAGLFAKRQSQDLDDIGFLGIYNKFVEGIHQDADLMALAQSGASKNLTIDQPLFAEIYPYVIMQRVIGLRAQLSDVFAEGAFRNFKLVGKEIRASGSTLEAAVQKLLPQLKELSRQDFENFVAGEIALLEKNTNIGVDGRLPLDTDGTPSECALVAVKMARSFNDLFLNPHQDLQDERIYLEKELHIDLAQLTARYRPRTEKMIAAAAQTKTSVPTDTDNIRTLDEIVPSFGLNVFSDSSEKEHYSSLLSTGLVTANFQGQSWWTNSHGGLADVTGATSRSLAQEIYGKDLIREFFWPNNTTDATPVLDKVRISVNSDSHGIPLSLEMLVKSTRSGRWEPYVFQRKADLWALQTEVVGEKIEQACMRCHGVQTAGGVMTLSPRPQILNTVQDFLDVGYKDQQLIENFLRF